MPKKGLWRLVRKRSKSGGAGGSEGGEQQQEPHGHQSHQVQQGQGQVPQHVLIVRASRSTSNITARSANLGAIIQAGAEEKEEVAPITGPITTCADQPPPTYEEVFGTASGDNHNDGSGNSSNQNRSDLRRSSASSKQNASAHNDSGTTGIEHVAIIKVKCEARPEQIQAMLDAFRSLAYTVDGVISLSVGKIFVNDFIDDSHGLARQNGYALRVRLRDMEAYEGWVASEARKAMVIEHAVPIMLPDCVPLVIAFESEEISGVH